jgi:hypothetical protein
MLTQLKLTCTDDNKQFSCKECLSRVFTAMIVSGFCPGDIVSEHSHAGLEFFMVLLRTQSHWIDLGLCDRRSLLAAKDIALSFSKLPPFIQRCLSPNKPLLLQPKRLCDIRQKDEETEAHKFWVVLKFIHPGGAWYSKHLMTTVLLLAKSDQSEETQPWSLASQNRSQLSTGVAFWWCSKILEPLFWNILYSCVVVRLHSSEGNSPIWSPSAVVENTLLFPLSLHQSNVDPALVISVSWRQRQKREAVCRLQK